MAIGVRARPTFLQGGKPTRAEAHAANAVALVNHRIGSLPLRTAVSDSLLATVFTLAFAEVGASHYPGCCMPTYSACSSTWIMSLLGASTSTG